jgi:hypothetical protein
MSSQTVPPRLRRSRLARATTIPVEEQLRRVVEKKGGKFCERCRCCEMRRQTCKDCDGVGYVTPNASDAIEPEQCETCSGCGGWWLCSCNDKGEHEERTT